jgi:uncharacterized protein
MFNNFIFADYFWIIYVTSFISSIISAAIGFVGGTVLFATMAQFLKLDVLIPLHGVIQFISNFSRAWILYKDINWQIGRDSIFGAMLGAIAGYFYVIRIPENWSDIILGLFIILITMVPRFKANFKFPGKWLVIGFFACSLGLFVGAVGTIVGSLFLAEHLRKKEMISTQAAMQSTIHIMKVFVFSFLGFSMLPWTLLITGSMLCAYLGTLVGAKVLDLISEKLFRILVTIIVIMLAIRLLLVGVYHIFKF